MTRPSTFPILRRALLGLALATPAVSASAPGAAAREAPDATVRTAPAVGVQPAPDATLLAEFRADPDAFFFDLRHRDILAAAQALLADPDAPEADRAAALRALGQVYAVRKAPAQARAAFAAYFALRPRAELEPASAWPPAVVRAFYGVRDSLGQEAPEPPAGVVTLAVGPMDNHSPDLPGAPFDMERFAAGLTTMIVSDLQPATSLQLVDRQRLEVLRREIALSRSGFVDPAQAVRAGRLLGAQSYLFGGVTMLPGPLVRIDLRLVETETGRILLSASKEGKVREGSDLLKLERQVVELLAKRLDTLAAGAGAASKSVSKAAKTALDRRKKSSGSPLALVEATGAALLAEDAGRLAEAATHWREALRLDPGNPLAAARVQALDTEHAYAQLEDPE
jgi:TolB-like protein